MPWSNIKIGSRALASYTYNIRTGAVEKMTYGNGDDVEYGYDNLDRLVEVQYNGTVTKDPSGELGIAALCGIGALAGGFINYASQVIQNHRSGKTGSDVWLDVSWGEVAGAAFEGAVSAVPGGGMVADLVGTVGGIVIEHGVDSLVTGSQFNIAEIGAEIGTDLLIDAFVPDALPDLEVPKYIRDIKQDALDAGLKGTRRLQAYLNFRQVTSIIINGFNSSTTQMIIEAY